MLINCIAINYFVQYCIRSQDFIMLLIRIRLVNKGVGDLLELNSGDGKTYIKT